MNILSEDYSPYGTFATRILIIWIIMTLISSIPVLFTSNSIYLVLLFTPIPFFAWGMWKQNKELFHN